LSLSSEKLVSKFAFKFNLYRYTEETLAVQQKKEALNHAEAATAQATARRDAAEALARDADEALTAAENQLTRVIVSEQLAAVREQLAQEQAERERIDESREEADRRIETTERERARLVAMLEEYPVGDLRQHAARERFGFGGVHGAGAGAHDGGRHARVGVYNEVGGSNPGGGGDHRLHARGRGSDRDARGGDALGDWGGDDSEVEDNGDTPPGDDDDVPAPDMNDMNDVNANAAIAAEHSPNTKGPPDTPDYTSGSTNDGFTVPLEDPDIPTFTQDPSLQNPTLLGTQPYRRAVYLFLSVFFCLFLFFPSFFLRVAGLETWAT
jgi:hypothetical protein